jgi:integrase
VSQTFDTKAEARRWQTEMRAQVQRGTWTDVRDGDELVSVFADRWLDGLDLAPGTVDSYRYGWARLKPTLGDLRLDQLRRPLLERTLAGLRRPDGQPLAASTRAATHAVLAMLLKAAVDQGQLPSSPLAGVRPPSVPRREVLVLDRAQLTRLLAKTDERWRPMLTVAVGTGLRQGELFGLRRQRVDFLRRTVAVEEQVTTGKGRPPALTSTLKTPASRRRLPVPDAVTRALSQVLEDRPDADAFFLTPRTGSLWRRSHFNETVWKPTLEAAKLPVELGFHVLRHTYASHLIAAGLHPRVIQARMGHASIVETMDTYGHLFPDGDDATRQALDQLLGDSADGVAAGS